MRKGVGVSFVEGIVHARRCRHPGHAVVVRVRRGNRRSRSHKAVIRETVEAIKDAWGQASRPGVPGPERFAGRSASVRYLFRRPGQPQESAGKAAQSRRGSPAGPRKGSPGDQYQGRRATRSAPSAMANSGSTSIPAIRRDLTNTRSSMRLNCRRPAATRCSQTCTRRTRRCRPRSRQKLKGKRALHIHEYNRAKQANHTGDISGIPHHYHPIFVTHPDTGRKTLFVDRLMTTQIEGMSDEESAATLATTLRHRRASRIHLRTCLEARRFPDVGQPLHDPRPHRFSEGRASAATPLHRRRRAT